MKKFPSLTNSRPCFRELKPKLNPNLEKLGEPHLDSFNHMLDSGLKLCSDKIVPVYLLTPDGERLCFKVEDIIIGRPSVPFGVINVKDRCIYPAECRQRNCSYSGMCTVRVSYSVDDLKRDSIEVELGEVPVMIKSKACNLNEMEPEKLVKHGEHDSEWGGFFIIKGNEKIIRMLLMSRRNYPIVLKRSSWKDRGQNFSEFGVMVRTVGNDEQSFNNVLHYLNNGTAKFMFSQNKFLSYIPVCLVLKTLVDLTDEKIYECLTKGYEHDKYYLSCIQNMLREVHVAGLDTHVECKNYLGEIFRSRFPEIPSWATPLDITEFILNERILIHLDSHKDKFNFIVFMVQKLFQCVQDKFKIENVDSVMMQEVLLGGQLYQKYVADRINIWLSFVKRYLQKKFEDNKSIDITSSFITTALKSAGGISKAIDSFLATGNIASRSGLGLMQSSGLVVMAENINRMRYMSHFRAVHRGSFFVTMRTTEARQLLPDAWGFICPVHTPDGTPCGLLNHLTVNCKISTREDPKLIEAIPLILTQCGMIPLDSPVQISDKLYIVQLEGCVLGHIRQVDGIKIVEKLRILKIKGSIPKMTEIAFVPYKEKGQFPGLFLFVGPSRMMRPVKNIRLNQIEYIGSMEQVYMDIAVDENEIYPNITTHLELTKIDFMSNLANLIPMPDLNQSPRNMYQCQMGKQTMGTPCLNWSKQAGTKLYRLQTPGTPLFRPVHHDNIDLDDFAMGTSAIVAVISYTGYDMEDAMIINKFAHDRGFAYGTIYKSTFVELQDTSYFARNPKDPTLAEFLDNDGLPHPGTKIQNRSILYCYFDTNEALYKVVRSKDKEEAIVDSVKYCGTFKASSPKTICITLRIPRAANIGDKFASRAGQKGICSQKYPAEDLPFSETGLIPDIVFNPHGFPSRMTIAMMVETMAGKSASLHGLVHDATPFTFSEKHTAIDYFGKLLEMGGYNYYGTERLYSGVDGREMNADIFMGVVYYQRLRHMVFDKWQVRSTGPVDAITHQPIKGRKYGGGIRFGEMERDALISHGASFLLQDRLFHNSDKVTELVCNDCGSLLAPGKQIIKTSKDTSTTRPICRICQGNTKCSFIEIPMAYKHLVTELSSININAKFKFIDI